MASRSKERERLRQDRLAAERRIAAAGRGRRALGFVVAGGLALAVLVGIAIVLSSGGEGVAGESLPENAFIAFPESGVTNGVEPDGREGTPPPALEQGDLSVAAKAAGCTVEQDPRDEGNDHVASPPDYRTSPATSGDHVRPPDYQADGAYFEPVAPFYYVHSHEHGRVTIHYSPDLPEDEQLALKGVFEEDPAGVLLFPDPDIEGEVAASSWGALMNCNGFSGQATIDAIRDFRDEYRGAYNPERVALAF